MRQWEIIAAAESRPADCTSPSTDGPAPRGTVTVAPFKGGQSTADSVFYENEGTLGGGSATSEVITAANGWVVVLSLGDRWLVVADDLDAT